MKYIIMCDGKGSRWNNYNNIPKHFVEVDGEPLIKRTVRQLNERVSDPIIITSHDKRYDIYGAYRYEPKSNSLEIDRFTEELIEDNICFLYGDTYYTDSAIEKIINTPVNDILFFGDLESIVAVKIKNGRLFKYHVDHVRDLYIKGKIKNCKGWQVYQSFLDLEFDVKKVDREFIRLDDEIINFNTPYEYENSILKR